MHAVFRIRFDLPSGVSYPFAVNRNQVAKILINPQDPLGELFSDASSWQVVASGQAEVSLTAFTDAKGKLGLRLDFDFHEGAGFVVMRKEIRFALPEIFEIKFQLRGEGLENHFEFKVSDPTGANAWRYLKSEYALPAEWASVRITERDLPFAWGPAGGGAPSEVGAMEWAIVAGPGGKGTVLLSDFTIEDQTSAAPHAITASSTQFGKTPEAAFADDHAAGWQADAQDLAPWWAVDFGKSVRCGGIILIWPDEVPTRAFNLETSSDGVKWVKIYHAMRAMGKRTHIAIAQGDIRCLRLSFSHADQAALVRLEMRPDAFSATPNEFIHAVAQDFPRGWFPRYWYREQSYWTPIGSPGGIKRALINEEGLVEVDEGGFSLEPFLWIDGKLNTWADAKIHLSLPPSGAPMPEVVWEINGITLTISPWLEGRGNALTFFISYRLETAHLCKDLRLSLAVRPFQVNPPWQAFRNLGGRSPIDTICCDKDGFQIGNLRVNSDSPADHFGAAAFEEGGILQYLSTGKIPERSKVEDPSALASAVIQWDLPESTQSHCKTLSFGYYQSHESPTPVGWQRTLMDWQNVLSPVEWQVPPCAKDAFICFRTAAAHILINRDGPAIQPGPRRYTRSWVRDCVIMGAALAKTGLPSALQEFIVWYVQFQYANGFVPSVVDRDGVDPLVEHDSHGQLLWGIREVYRTNKDLEFLESMLPAVQGAAEYLIQIRATRKTAHYLLPEHHACYGLLPESASHEGYLAHPVHSYWDDFWGIRGLEAAADVAKALGHGTLAERWRDDARDFTHDVIQSIQRVIQHKQLGYIPGSVEWADFDPTATSNAITQLDFADILPQAPLHQMFETYLYGFRQKHRGEIPWNNYTAYEIRIIGAMVRLGKRDEAHELLEFFLSDRRPCEWNQWPEITWNDSRTPGHLGDVPHTWIAAEYLLALASMVASEREQSASLVLAAGISWSWISYENGMGVRGLPTTFGTVNFHIRAIGTLHIWFEIGAHLAIPPGGLFVAPPLPPATRIREVIRTDGTKLKLTPNTNNIIIEELPCDANIILEQF